MAVISMKRCETTPIPRSFIDFYPAKPSIYFSRTEKLKKH
jgi:hypothetical protein